MIYKNGTMELVCLNGKSNKEAIFLITSNNELVKGIGMVWDGENVRWERGCYMGNIKIYLDLNMGTK